MDYQRLERGSASGEILGVRDVLDTEPHQLFRRAPHDRAEPGIDGDEPTGQIGAGDAGGALLEQLTQPHLALVQGLSGLPVGGNVPNHPQQLGALRVPTRGRGQPSGHPRPG